MSMSLSKKNSDLVYSYGEHYSEYKSITYSSPFESSVFTQLFCLVVDSIFEYDLSPELFLYTSCMPLFTFFNSSNLVSFNLLILLPVFFIFFFSESFERSLFFKLLLTNIYTFFSEIFSEYVSENRFFLFPYTCYLFVFLISSNVVGLVPFTFSLSSHLSFTFLLAFIIWFTSTTLSLLYMRDHFISHFLITGIPNILVPILFIIELLSFFIRVVSLSLRLFANIFSGHILIHVICSAIYSFSFLSDFSSVINSTIMLFTSILIFSVLFVFELLVGILQAYIFVLLSLIYLSDL